MALRLDFSGLTDAQLDAMIAGTQQHYLAILTGAQSGTVGDSRSFSMARLPELMDTLSALSAEKRNRGNVFDDDFMLGSFAEPDGGQIDHQDVIR